MPARSRFGNAVSRLSYTLVTGLRIHDTQSGLRAFTADLIPELLMISGERYEYEINVLLRCANRQIPIRELKIETIYWNNNAGSHFHPLRDSCLVYRELLKFPAASFAGFLTDYTVYSLMITLIGHLSAGLLLSNILTRVVSASVNYTLNRTLVFKSRAGSRSAVQYFGLAAGILAGNTLVLAFLSDVLSVNRYAAKICTELLFFFGSWIIQRCVIFRPASRAVNRAGGE